MPKALETGTNRALMLGKKFWVLHINGQYSGTGPQELALFRTFIPSPARPHALFLEFEVEFQRAKRGNLGGHIPKVIVELQDEQLELEQEIEAKGIMIDEGDDRGSRDDSSDSDR